MTQGELLAHIAQALDACEIQYLVTGSMASSTYGVPRLTRDIDVVCAISPDDVEPLLDWFPDPPFYVEPQAVRLAAIHRHQFNIIRRPDLKIDMYPTKRTEHDLERMARGQAIEFFPGVVARAASPEDVIVKKLEFLRESGHPRHIRDIGSMLDARSTTLDFAYIDRWARELRVDGVWAELQSTWRAARSASRPPSP